ncbi:MAG: UPF0182 family protein [Actinomycetota bacterium]|nr:UPF0182 family protein [Actinomycetota bacterium]
MAKPRSRHARWWIVGSVIILILLLGSLRSLAGLYTDSLWFSSVGFHRVWSTLLAVKVGLFASFGAAFFVLLWANLVICDRIAAHTLSVEPADDFVLRYQRVVRPYAGRVYAVVALAIALIAAATTLGQWNNWLLFTHARSFPHTDPLFGLNDGFFVFRLPFLQFLVNWTLASLVVVLVLTAVFHYLNGGIRPRGAPRVRPIVKVHLSVLVALIALVKAGGYVLARYGLELSTNGYVEGAGYTAVHARLPAIDLLFFVSLFAAAILLYNIRRQGWTLPVLAVGVWAFVALVIGVIYPAVLQALEVNPAQSKLEQPYIARNIEATRYAYGIDHVKVSRYPDRTVVPVSTVDAHLTTLDNIRLWDPSSTISLVDFRTKQDITGYYTFQTVQVDRYTAGGTIRPVIVGVRQIDSTNLPSSSWVNEHLQYTHGEGLVMAEANEATTKGNPVFAISDVPDKSVPGFPQVRQPAIYFGVKQPGYVVVDTRQRELDGLTPTGTDVEGHYRGTGGVRLGSFLTRAAFALRLGDLNLLLSNLVTTRSRIMFIRDVRSMAQKVAPFLSYDAQPYPALVDGHVDWILNAYTTTANYPYSQNAGSFDLPPGARLTTSYNYVRNSVVVVVNAYSGKMTFYAMDHDPILQAYESAFPGLFTPESDMPPSVRAQLRYGSDLFAVQAAVYGRYHITSPAQFYSAGDAWIVSPTTGVSSPTQLLRYNHVLTSQGRIISSYQPMTPVYQVEAEPGQTTQSFTVTDAYVPAGAAGIDSQFLRALLVGNSDPTQFGQLHVYETPPGKSKIGPIQAETEIAETTTISSQITLLNKEGSSVLLGNILPVLVGGSVLYVRPLYVESKAVPQPQLKYVIAVLGQRVQMERTLGATLNTLLGTTLKSTGGNLTTTPRSPNVPSSSPSSGSQPSQGSSPSPPPSGEPSASIARARALLQEAATDFTKAQADLKAGDLGGYQSKIAKAQAATAEAEALLAGGARSSGHSKRPSVQPSSVTGSSASIKSARTPLAERSSSGSGTGERSSSGTSSPGKASGGSDGSGPRASSPKGSGLHGSGLVRPTTERAAPYTTTTTQPNET